MTPPVNLSFFPLVVSAIAIFRLADNLMPNHLQIGHLPNYKLNHLQTQTVTQVFT